ncbi:MAG: DUF3341 domain-containing protein [Methylorubrum populi]
MAALSHPAASRTDPLYGAPVVGPGETVASIGDALAGAVLAPAGRRWRRAAAAALAPILAWAGSEAALPGTRLDGAGGGWWIGLAAGCLMIAGLLRLADVAWRCGIDRSVQSAALLCAGIAALHPVPVGPVSLAGLFAVGFGLWGAALLPDLAVLRDRLAAGAGTRPGTLRARFYRALSAGWRGSALQWLAWTRACRGLALLAILAAVAVLMDLALTDALRSDRQDLLRRDTLRPVALLVEAVLAGAGLTAALAPALRRVRGLDGLVTGRHLDILGRLILVFGLAALYCHVTQIVTAVLYGGAADRGAAARRLLGEGAPAFWTLVLVGLMPSQLFWIGAVRRSATGLGLIGAVVAVGLRADHDPIAGAVPGAGLLAEAFAEAVGFLGPLGLCGFGLLLVFRLVPPVSIAQTRELALAHNPRAEARAPEGVPETGSGLVAVFASEAGLAEAARDLSVLDRPPRLDAFGPVPMPDAAAALHRDEGGTRRLALLGAVLGVAAFLAVRAFSGEGGAADGSTAATALSGAMSWAMSWAMLAVPALSAAVLGGTFGIAAALLLALTVRPDGVAPSALTEPFVLTVEPSAGGRDPAALARRLRRLPETGGRPLALYGGAAAAGPRR